MKFLVVFTTGEVGYCEADTMVEALENLTWKYDQVVSISKTPEEQR